jgi:uncharacterized protein (TIGR00369 family)
MSDQPIPIHNPFAGHGEYNCFGCDPDNPIGLKLSFVLEGESVSATWTPRSDLEGYPGVVHGGVQATLIDEVAAWCAYAALARAGVTKQLRVEYLKPARVENGPFRVVATAVRSDEKLATIAVTLTDARETLCASGEVELALFSDEIGRRRFGFPGIGAFLPDAE